MFHHPCLHDVVVLHAYFRGSYLFRPPTRHRYLNSVEDATIQEKRKIRKVPTRQDSPSLCGIIMSLLSADSEAQHLILCSSQRAIEAFYLFMTQTRENNNSSLSISIVSAGNKDLGLVPRRHQASDLIQFVHRAPDLSWMMVIVLFISSPLHHRQVGLITVLLTASGGT
ncbi:uncharacterized protein BT62DRAFT_364867 [Guyanagaster necrorhizus]|uniref:Uncharacterized protein n=1 Tax=Guyanagaster necrorhizus TaxID=856835 RepID=A0A9P8APH1_9AGAR|nr:uncharacterized protein BT62DRAFT_364867 [Guyanagaster necrorhizus MCA 3950]KAG7442940.1 hypothetical protein BT62DRAFT_364867 [Guyanagaster necrorhizus MCA 3950]